VRLCYLPPGGAFGHAVASIFGADPKAEMDADLLRLKTVIETGRAPHGAAHPTPRESWKRGQDPFSSSWPRKKGPDPFSTRP
jgi:hypothetical protein